MTSLPGIVGRTFYRIEVSAMYDKRECLTSKEAWELGVHTARFIGMSKRDMQLFDDILMVQVRDYAYQKMRRRIPAPVPAIKEGPQGDEYLRTLIR